MHGSSAATAIATAPCQGKKGRRGPSLSNLINKERESLPPNMEEIYVSTDVEADGPIPGPHSMLSFASAVYLADKTLDGTFEANLETLPGVTGEAKTMAWWKSQPKHRFESRRQHI